MILALTKGYKTIIDDADAILIGKYRWHVCFGSTKPYATAWIKNKKARLHRFLLRPSKDFVVDHINQDSLDNRRCNLRIVKPLDNVHNSTLLWAHNTSGCKNVYYHHKNRNWYVQKRFKGVKYTHGSFKTKEEAITIATRLRDFKNLSWFSSRCKTALALDKKKKGMSK